METEFVVEEPKIRRLNTSETRVFPSHVTPFPSTEMFPRLRLHLSAFRSWDVLESVEVSATSG
jgi:hypothetical protein